MKLRLRAAAVACACLATGPAAWGKTHTVIIEGMRFNPETLTVKRGDRVTWVNRDVVPHTATAGRTFDSGAIGPGASWSIRVKTPGQTGYVCALHPMMKAYLNVQ